MTALLIVFADTKRLPQPLALVDLGGRDLVHLVRLQIPCVWSTSDLALFCLQLLS